MSRGKHALPRPPLGASPAAAGRHRSPQRGLTDVLPSLGTTLPAVAGTFSVAAVALLPGAASAAPDVANNPGAQPAEAGLVNVPSGARYAPPSQHDLAKLRQCESTGNYSVDTGNGFFGAYQFDLQTWRSLGLGGLPQQADPVLQDAAAAALEQTRGWRPWPACSSHLGLVPQRAHGVPVAQVAGTLTGSGHAPVVAVKPAGGRHRAAVGSGPSGVPDQSAPVHQVPAPPFAGHVLSAADARHYRSDVRTWQERMSARGWRLTPDGYFGPRSQAVARAFASEKGLSDGLPGEVGAGGWAAAWTAPLH